MTLKLAQFCVDPPKNIHKIFIPQKILIYLKTPKNTEIQNFEPKKIARADVCVKISEYPPPRGADRTLNTPLIYMKTFSNNLLSDNKCRLPKF